MLSRKIPLTSITTAGTLDQQDTVFLVNDYTRRRNRLSPPHLVTGWAVVSSQALDFADREVTVTGWALRWGDSDHHLGVDSQSQSKHRPDAGPLDGPLLVFPERSNWEIEVPSRTKTHQGPELCLSTTLGLAGAHLAPRSPFSHQIVNCVAI